MNNSDFWLLKLNALLHDPPDKPLDIKRHEGQAQNWATTLRITLGRQDYKEADWIASAADRLNFPNYKSIGIADFRRNPYLSHPLAGVRLNLGAGRLFPNQINDEQLQKVIKQSLQSIAPTIKADPKKLFLWLWRNWSAQIQTIEGNQFGALWDLLPADTRIPDHPIWIHQALTSAIAGTESNPAFLLFTIGPVQPFISAARRTQDLWAGSYLLSYLNWAAIEAIAEEIGPDAVIFPNLLGQPLCDRWLHSKDILPERPQQRDLILPSLPNRFLAIVPASQGAELAEQAAQKVRSQWREISKTVREDLESLFKQPLDWSETWERQTENFFETYWQVYPWRPTGREPIQANNFQQFLNPHKPYLGSRAENTQKILTIYRDDTGTYPPNIGAIYSDLYFITEKTLGSRKGLRNFPQVYETGDKSTLGGDRAALYKGVDCQSNNTADFDRVGRREIRQFWQHLSKRLREQNRYEIPDNGQERLDAVELTKRCAWRSYLEKQPGFEPIERDKEFRFPSTHSIASASFKDAILTRLDKQDSKSLRKALEAWVNKVYPISQGNRSDRKVIPYLTAKANLSAQPLDLLNHFLSLDGRLLFEETYQNPDEFHGADRGQIEIARKALKDFLKVASQNYKIPKPRNYFAVLMMDGDSMGQWLSGDKMPNYEKVLHPNTHKALEQRSDWQQILENRRLMSPAIHGFISKALGDFSLKLVRHIVENRYPGKLVYAGGDDVLALLPVDSVLKVARELRAAFSGEIYTGIGTEEEGKPFEVRFGDRYARSGYVSLQITGEDKPRLLPTMGCQATASTGIAIAHRLSPLDLTLQEVRKAEKDAKGKEGRNAFSITFLKRSGETMSAGAKWTYRQNCGESNLLPIDTVSVLLEFQRKFAENSISSKFPYILQEEAETLSLLEIQEIQVLYKAEIKRLLLRQQGSKQLSKEVADDLAEKLAILVTRANEEKRVHAKDENKAKPQGKLKTFADILTFTRFLATGEGED